MDHSIKVSYGTKKNLSFLPLLKVSKPLLLHLLPLCVGEYLQFGPLYFLLTDALCASILKDSSTPGHQGVIFRCRPYRALTSSDTF